MGRIVRKAVSRRHANAALLHRTGFSSSTMGLRTRQEAIKRLNPASLIRLSKASSHAHLMRKPLDASSVIPSGRIPHRPDGKLGGIPHCGFYQYCREQRGVDIGSRHHVDDSAFESLEFYFGKGRIWLSACFGHRAWRPTRAAS